MGNEWRFFVVQNEQLRRVYGHDRTHKPVGRHTNERLSLVRLPREQVRDLNWVVS